MCVVRGRGVPWLGLVCGAWEGRAVVRIGVWYLVVHVVEKCTVPLKGDEGNSARRLPLEAALHSLPGCVGVPCPEAPLGRGIWTRRDHQCTGGRSGAWRCTRPWRGGRGDVEGGRTQLTSAGQGGGDS